MQSTAMKMACALSYCLAGAVSVASLGWVFLYSVNIVLVVSLLTS